MAQITINDEDIYYDHVYCTVGDFSKQESTRKITWYLDGNEYHSVTLLGSTARTSYNIRGLKPSTSYQISVKMVSNATGKTFWYYKTVTTKPYPYASSDSVNKTSYVSSFSYITIAIGGITSRDYVRTVKYQMGTISQNKTLAAGDVLSFATFSELNYGTTYSIIISIINPDGNVTWTNTIQATTDSDYATLNISNKTDSSVNISITNIKPRDYERTVRCVVNNTLERYVLPANNTSCSFYFDSLSPNTTYTIDAGIRKDDNDISTRSWRDNSKSFKTSTSIILSLNSTYNSVTLTATLTSSKTYSREILFYLDDRNSVQKTLAAGKTVIDCKFTTDIKPATKYACSVKNSDTGETKGPFNIRTKNNFHWSDSQWNMNVTKGAKFYFNPDAWNEFADQLEAKAKYYGYTYDHASVSKGAILTAVRYNGVASIINTLVTDKKGDCKTKVPLVSAGDPVTADCINILATCLNE